MNLVFHNDIEIDKLFLIHHFFSPVGNTSAINDYFIGDPEIASKINNVYRSDGDVFRKRALMLWMCGDRKIEQKYRNKATELALLLEKLELGYVIYSEDEACEIENGLNDFFNKNKVEINRWFNKIFRFSLPNELHIVLTKSPSNRSFGESILFKPTLIGLSVSKKTRSIPGIILHEILHVLIAESGVINRKDNSDRTGLTPRNFSEALIEYFAPFGILAEKFDLISNSSSYKNPRESMNEKIRAESLALEEPLKRYRDVLGETTIWKFLSNNGFADMFDQKVIARLNNKTIN